MSGGGGVAPSVLETLEFPAALECVAAYAAGPLGAARVRARTPATSPDAVRAELARVAELAALLLTDDSPPPPSPLRAEPVPDIAQPLALLAVPGSVLEGPAFVAVADALAAARVTAGDLARVAVAAPRTAALRVEPPPKELERRLREALAPDGELLDGASRELARARRAVREARERLVARLEAILGALDPVERAADAAVTVRSGRYVIPVRATARTRVGGIVHDESATRATVFLEPPEAIELGNELRSREAAERREVLRVLRELTDLLRPHAVTIAAAWEMCIAFDDLCARARYAVEVNGFAPRILDPGAGALTIRQGRHPLLVDAPSQSERPVVPFDLALAADEWTVLISGPNTGGKTVLIKAVGLLCLLAQSGIIPPIGPDSSLPVFRQVFADIGDRQSIAASLSTFSAHVAALREILERVEPVRVGGGGGRGDGALVLLDEVGSGTDPAEGAALAGAVLLALTRRRAVTLATTHLGALKRLASESVGVVNASLQFDADTLTPTYRLLKGVPGRSYGLAIARRLGLDATVLADAERAVPDAERALDALLATVEARARELETLERSLRALEQAQRAAETSLATRHSALDERERAVETRARTLERAAREQARAYLLEARKTVEAALAQARAAMTEATAREARRLVEQAIEETKHDGRMEGRNDEAVMFRVGDRVRTPQGASGTVREIREDGDLVVEVGSVRLVVPQSALVPAGEARMVPAHVPSFRPSVASSEVSLRGLRVDEAERELTRALDAAVQADLPALRVIHGKGTGALRQRVHALLAADPRVQRFGFAPAAQGGAGVTVVELHA